MKAKFQSGEWIPLLGAERNWDGRICFLSYILADGQTKKVIVSERDTVERRGRIFIRKTTAQSLQIPTL